MTCKNVNICMSILLMHFHFYIFGVIMWLATHTYVHNYGKNNTCVAT